MDSPPKNVTEAIARYKDVVEEWERKYEAIQCAMEEATVKEEFEILQKRVK